ncbi:Stk1 family PASTA domain-containing Ser/Thr kinase, partial [Frisingicoccus sp.]|uniref:Stk1 family PASTA domain-containing Ser/Thr kinase n=1 Tax=Frisingicoccus sp. TaxID=1918627 RepID=UPI0025BBD46A
MLTSGTILAGRYEIVGRIGAGGMSNVYKAKDQKLNRFVAIKVLKPEYSADAMFVKKFRVEAQSAAGLSHPNIVNVYDVGEENGIHFIVMELVQGITLKHYIERKGHLDIREVLNISVQIASGMGAAHANRIIHRDIKPQNVIMSRDGKVKVTDFGIAKAADSTTVTTNAAGSVHYISPEQARGGYSDEKSDIYSLGITMYEMVTGRVPYDGENNVAVALQHIQGNMTPPRQINPDIPRSVERIIMKCTQKKPDLRYGSAKELIMDLRRALVEPDGSYVVIGPAAMNNNLADGVGDSTTVVMDEEDIEKLRQASLKKDTSEKRRSQRISPEERRRRQLEEERREYEEYDNHHERKKAKKPVPVVQPEEEYDDESDDVNPALDKTMMIFGIVGAVIIAIVIFFIIGRAGGLFGGGTSNSKATKSTESSSVINTESSQVDAPDCEGRTQEEAIELLEKAGLKYKITEKEDSSVKAGNVISQKPAAGTKMDKGTIVTLTISKGVEMEDMPDVTGMSL